MENGKKEKKNRNNIPIFADIDYFLGDGSIKSRIGKGGNSNVSFKNGLFQVRERPLKESR